MMGLSFERGSLAPESASLHSTIPPSGQISTKKCILNLAIRNLIIETEVKLQWVEDCVNY